MDVERRALFNSLRQSFMLDQNLAVEPWQVEDYRSMTLDAVFNRLNLQDIRLDKSSFTTLAEEFDTPEELTEHLLGALDVDDMTTDQVYLLVFELWRRLVPEKPSLTIFCDELDNQIHLYDSGLATNPEAIQDAMANLKVLLDENVDEGCDPLEVFDTISAGCANDIENFLYDFIAEQIDAKNISYASELLDAFAEYVRDTRWFDFLRVRVMSHSDPAGADLAVRQLIKENTADPELEFNLEVLAYLVQGGNKGMFINLVKQTMPLLKTEEDLQDLLLICADFYHLLDQEHIEHKIHNILKKRSTMHFESKIIPKDQDIDELLKILAS